MSGPRPRRSRTAGRDALGSFGVWVAARRQELGLTQRDLADLTGVSVDSVHAVETGKPSLRLDVLLGVLDALGLALVGAPKSAAERLATEADAVIVAAHGPVPEAGAPGSGR